MPLKRTPPSSSATTSSFNKNVKSLIGTPAIPADLTILHHSESAPDLPSLLPTCLERKKRKFDGGNTNVMAELQCTLDLFTTEQNKRFEELVSTVKNQNMELINSLDLISKKYDEFLIRVEHLETERKEDKKYIRSLEDKLETLERKSRASGIEIRNIPKTTEQRQETKEDLCKVIISMGKALDISIQESDIRDTYRTNSKESSKPIIAEFTTNLLREKVLKAIKSFNKSKPKEHKLKTCHFLSNLPSKPVFVSETLTPQSQKLFYLARNFQKHYGYKYCWTSHGLIYLRKEENLPQIKIDSEVDLDKIRLKD